MHSESGPSRPGGPPDITSGFNDNLEAFARLTSRDSCSKTNSLSEPTLHVRWPGAQAAGAAAVRLPLCCVPLSDGAFTGCSHASPGECRPTAAPSSRAVPLEPAPRSVSSSRLHASPVRWRRLTRYPRPGLLACTVLAPAQMQGAAKQAERSRTMIAFRV